MREVLSTLEGAADEEAEGADAVDKEADKDACHLQIICKHMDEAVDKKSKAAATCKEQEPSWEGASR
jgi:hypothetical protein